MSDIFDILKERIKEFPTQSGVYLMKNQLDKIIYVGKAKNLRNRVKNYFTGSKDHSAKTKALVFNIVEIEYLLTKTEVEAFLLEASLIKKHRPKYNIRLKDDKSYPYIQLSWQNDYPRLYLSRKVKKDGSLYFGPYTSGGAVFGTIRFLNRLFKIRDCTDHVFKTRSRPCMTHQIGRCTAPCVQLISKEDYRADVEGAKDFLKGRSKKLIKDLEKRMHINAGEEKFEVAAKMRDSMFAIKSIIEKQTVINDTSEKDQDAVSFFGDERGVLIETIHIRSGRVIGNRSHFINSVNPNSEEEDPREWLASVLNQYYEDNFIPDEVLLSVDLGSDIHRLLQDVLKARTGRDVIVRFATDEKGHALVEMASTNAKAHFEKQVSKEEEKKQGLDEIRSKLNLPKRPFRIECFDVSHFQGSETVASQVVFEDGVPSKEHYRRYKIKTVAGIDDFASMYEVLKRRFSHAEYDEPDLLVVDGGKGQLSQAVRILQELGKTHIPVVGLAKARTESNFKSETVDSTEERFYLPGRANPVVFKTNSEAYQILVGLRDEAHRFAITFHRERREKSSLESELDYIVGLGEKRKKLLLQKFKSIDEIRDAEVEDIAAVKSFNRVLAERIILQLQESEDEKSVDEFEDSSD
ncbi:MAG: excinuclease ABC subunit C [Bdellovibrionales bacterium RIFCSPHIGHO2_01_FULL_40_29]|nr:MAG: excinuclease ABC subunit C [Bdellovibrionales bacterium RIFCSPHIGHO2_01_FULL_40_29]OFZ32626.1 MAG: excinuclease ABC subunit C [Bdellovibrionales bacterium RIFCSPHIGHO2_02_FULL_40_15]